MHEEVEVFVAAVVVFEEEINVGIGPGVVVYVFDFAAFDAQLDSVLGGAFFADEDAVGDNGVVGVVLGAVHAVLVESVALYGRDDYLPDFITSSL